MHESDVLAFVREHWTDVKDLVLLPSHQNQVFSGMTTSGDIIVRCTSASHRSRSQVEDELSWMSFLRARGVPIPKTLSSAASSSIETLIMEESEYHVVVFERVPGVSISTPGILTESTVLEWGRTLGRVHDRSIGFESRIPFRWAGDESGILAIETYLSHMRDAPDSLTQSANRIRSRSKTRETYGLIHGDCQDANVLVCDGKVYLIDFDDCCSHWRMFDIASAVFGLYFDACQSRVDPSNFAAIARAFIRGFVEEFPNISSEIETLPDYLTCRTGLLFAWSGGLAPVPRGIASSSAEWRSFLRSSSLEELQTGRIRDAIG